MSKRLSAANQARYHQVAAVLRDAASLPLATAEVGRRMGYRLHHFSRQEVRPVLERRPPCWPDHITEADADVALWCAQCDAGHEPPVWRQFSGMDARPALVRLERQGLARRFVLDGHRTHYWQWTGPDDGATT